MDVLKGNFLINTREEAVIANEIFRDSKYVGLYFSASWCPPCQTFLPLLKEMYEDAHSRQIKLEIIFVPADSDNQQMTRFFIENHGPWFAVPVGPVTATLRAKMQVYSIPYLIILNDRGKVITRDGREDLENYDDPLAMWFTDSPSVKSGL